MRKQDIGTIIIKSELVILWSARIIALHNWPASKQHGTQNSKLQVIWSTASCMGQVVHEQLRKMVSHPSRVVNMMFCIICNSHLDYNYKVKWRNRESRKRRKKYEILESMKNLVEPSRTP